jgi:predicted nucleic acid-binding protein
MTFADTNWLAAMFFELKGELQDRNEIVRRFLRRHAGQMLISEVVMIEAENVFRRSAGSANPPELDELKNDGRFYRDPMNWALVRRDAVEVFRRHAHKLALGTFDVTLLASAKLAGANTILSFDQTFKALAVAEGLEVFPELDAEGKSLLKKFRN